MAIDNKKMEEISKRFLDLPEDLQKALFSAQTSDAIFEVGKKHGLAVDKMGELADETGLVMLGMTKPSEYIKNLASRLALEPEKAKAIAEDINQKVFSTIRESLKKIHGIIPHPQREFPPLKVSPPYEGGVLRQQSEGGGLEKKVEKILHDHEAAKQEKKETKLPVKIIMPEITEKELKEPATEEKIPPTSPILSGKIVEEKEKKQEVPDVFVKKIPPTYQNNDPYKEPTK